MSVKETKPDLNESQASKLVSQVFGLNVSQIRPLPSYDDQNFHVVIGEVGEFVLKIMNTADSQNLPLLELQTHVMTFLRQQGLPAQTALPTCTGDTMSLETIDCGFGSQKYLVRLLTYLPGIPIAKISYSPGIHYEVGKMAATVDTLLQEMVHPNLEALQRKNFIWSLSSIPLLEPYLHVMDGDPLLQVISDVIKLYKSEIVPKLGSFRKCINHGDLNDHNILVEKEVPTGYKISGILDFGDMSAGYFVYELAITIMYMMIESPDPLGVGGPLLAGWESVFPLNKVERDGLYILVLCRFCQSLVLARHAVTIQPENEEYLMTTAKTGRRHLSLLWELGKEQVERRWFEVARLCTNSQ